ncbi:hypothetical protein SAMN04490248_1793 [Salinihabitans flavidus]|uniref:Uncharacterized protein n=1 Tax=Salinihabitans flavidus TaxID=569882 RepID=A0A1H8WLD2_9RHOB|nr:hypothetical protein [Salinihabitans flavidus]SEP28432.1 hypothetical protein SAMN04490248_1793 [Salinihabitans flavidus]
MSAPHLTLVVSNEPWPEDGAGRDQMSCPNRLEPYRLRAEFPELWSGYVRSRFRRIEDVAVFFDVRFQTACNWWHGDNRPSGDKVALAVLTDPAGFAAHFAGDRRRAA